MKKTIFIFLVCVSHCLRGQDTITYTYTLDTFGVDSFFLIETVKTPQLGLPRGTEIKTPFYFRDTSELTVFINVLKADSSVIERQFKALSDQKAAWNYKIKRLECLRDSVFKGANCGGGIGSRMVAMPPPEMQSAEPEYGYWIIYTNGKRAHIPPGEEPELSGTILYPDGRTERYRKPKSVKL